MISPTALMIKSLPHLTGPSPYVPPWTSKGLTNPLVSWFELTSLALAWEPQPQSTQPMSRNKGIHSRSYHSICTPP